MRARHIASRKRTAVAATVLAVGGLILHGGSAQAAVTDRVCLPKAICIWTNENYTGWRMYASFPNQGPLSAPFDNSVDSVGNGTDRVVLLYDNYDATGARLLINPGEWIPKLSARGFANKASYMVG